MLLKVCYVITLSALIIQITYSQYHNRCAPISSPSCRYIMQRRRGSRARPRVFNDFSHFATPSDASRSPQKPRLTLKLPDFIDISDVLLKFS